MADTIRCACDALNAAAGHLATLRISEIRQSLDFLGVQHTEVLLGLLVFILMQFTKFAAILMLAICLAYGIFFLWDNFFPGIAEFGHKGIRMCRNVRTSANLPPFTHSDGDESSAPGEYTLTPTAGYLSGMKTPHNSLNGTMLLPMVQTGNKVFRDHGLQTGKARHIRDETAVRGSRGRSFAVPPEPGKHRQEQPYWQSMSPEQERDRERQHHSSRRSGQGTSHESKRPSNILRIPNITSGVVDFRHLPKVTSEDLKRLPNITSGESRRSPPVEFRRSPPKEESRRLQNVTSGEMGASRRVPKITSHTNESPRWLNVTRGEVRESRRRERSSHPQETGESRRPSNGHGGSGGGGGGVGESKSRRPSERPYPAQGRRPEEQPRQRHRITASSDDSRPGKQRRSVNNNSRSGVIRRQFPDDHIERLKMENRDYQARRLAASGAAFRQSGGHPTSEGAMLTRQENFVANFRRSDRRESQRSPRSSNPEKDEANRNRKDRKKDPRF